MKYDFDLDLTTNNSLLLILKQIKTNSVILEFGPATGRMTKYLKQELNCDVYLAELDEEAGKQALQYGKDLVVGDVEQFEWLEKYKDIRFDYIIFADVLEHLRNPKLVLERCKLLLKQEGSVLLSVPNLAHNSVLINLLNNEFEYNSVGLLDNTHIHFFTKNSLENMIREASYAVSKRMGTYSRVGENEIVNIIPNVNGISDTYWNTREFGEVYQFVYELKNSRELVTNETNSIRPTTSNYYAQVYFGKNGYSENDTTKLPVENMYGVTRFNFDLTEKHNSFRFDPVNNSCLIRITEVVGFAEDGSGHGMRCVWSNSVINNGTAYAFTTTDPCLIYITEDGANVVRATIVVEYITIDSLHMEKITNSVIDIVTSNNGIVESLMARNRELEERLSNVNMYASDALKEVNAELTTTLENIEKEKKDKDKRISELEEQVGSLCKVVEEKDRVLTGILNSRSWKLTKILRHR